MQRRAVAAFGVFVRRQIRDVFLIWIRILCLAHFNWVPFWFCSQTAQRIWTTVRRWRLITALSCVSLAWWCRLWRLWSASDHAHQLAVYLSSLRSYYLS